MTALRYLTLGEVATLKAGVGFPLDLQGRASGDFPFAKVGDISRVGRSGDSILDSADHYVAETDLLRLKARPIPEGSILFPKIGEAISQNHRVIAGRPLLVDNNAMAAIPGASVVSRYLYHFLRTVDFYPLASSTTVPALRKSELEQLLIPIPPLAQQRRIAAILDKADELRAKRRAAIAHLDTLTQSLFLEMFGDPETNPKGWPRLPLSKLLEDAEVFVDGDWVESKDQDPNGDVRLIQLADIGDGTYVDKSHRFLNKAAALRLKCTLLKRGDVLVARMPDPLGRACIFPGDVKEAVTVVDVCIIRPRDSRPNPVWLMCCLNSPGFRGQIAREATGTTRERISRGNLSKLHMIAPPDDLQDEFAVRVDRLRPLRDRMAAAIVGCEQLFASLQSRAFRGEL